MLVKKETAMATKNQKGYLRSKILKLKKRDMPSHGETASLHQGRVLESHGLKKGYRKSCSAEDEPANRLVKIELDAAEALAEFSRIAHLPHQQNFRGECDAGLQWSGKRKRTTRPSKDVIGPCSPKEKPQDAHFSVKKNRSFCALRRDSSTSDRDELESMTMLLEGGKESPPFDSRAESPSSPLPSLQLACRTFLVGGGPTAKSAFQRVVPLGPVQKPCLLPVKKEIEEVHLESSAARPQKVAVRRKPKARKPTVSVAPVKTEPLGEYDIGTNDPKDAGNQDAESGVKSLANIASLLVEVSQEVGLAVVNKSKAALSEKEKEARRLRRIQANRESARQTIRRKQILCEELTKKAASLALENEGMKQKRELLMQELYSLKGQNYHLKQQLEMGSSGNLGLESAELSPRTSSQPVSLPALQVPSLPYTGVPLQSFVWAVAVAQAATTANQQCLLNNNEMMDGNFRKITNDQPIQHQAAAFVFPVSSVTEQKLNHNSNGVCSPTLTSLSQKEMSSTAGVCVESCTLQSEGAPGLAARDAQQGSESANGADLPGKPACEVSMQARGSSSQPTAVLPFTSKSGLDDVRGTSMSMECYMGPQIAQVVRYGFSCNGSKGGVPMKGPLYATLYTGRKTYAAAMAAAEARRRRKELTRSKLSRSRAFRLLHS